MYKYCICSVCGPVYVCICDTDSLCVCAETDSFLASISGRNSAGEFFVLECKLRRLPGR